jgi:hypothetical protein
MAQKDRESEPKRRSTSQRSQQTMQPEWYGLSYPSETDLASFAESLGAWVTIAKLPAALYVPGPPGEAPVILIPSQHGPLAAMWRLAHEIGHLVQHSGPKGDIFWSKGEAQANRWAACALIPKARIDAHNNASVDAFIAALSAHYEDIPPRNCPLRTLANRIAKVRLGVLQSKNQ